MDEKVIGAAVVIAIVVVICVGSYPLMNSFGTCLTTQLKFAGDNTPKIYLAFFGNPWCPPCDNVWAMIIRLEQVYPNLVPRRFDFLTKENIELIEALFNLDNVENTKRGADRWIFIGDNYLSMDSITEGNIRSLILEYSQTGTEPPWEIIEPEPAPVPSGISIWLIIGIVFLIACVSIGVAILFFGRKLIFR